MQLFLPQNRDGLLLDDGLRGQRSAEDCGAGDHRNDDARRTEVKGQEERRVFLNVTGDTEGISDQCACHDAGEAGCQRGDQRLTNEGAA